MKKLYDNKSIVKIGPKDYANWQALLSSGKVLEKMRDNNGVTDVVILSTIDDNNQKVPLDFLYANLKTELRRIKEHSVFVMFDSVVEQKAAILGKPECSMRPFVVNSGKKRFFLGDDFKPDEDDKIIYKECVSVKIRLGTRILELYLPVAGDVKSHDEIFLDIEDNDFIVFSAMKIPILRNVKGKTPYVDEIYLATEYDALKDDFSDVAHVIPKINSVNVLCPFIDVKAGEPLYSDDINKIILYDVFYVKIGEPVFDLILFGAGGSGKSKCVMIHGLVFSDDGTFIDGTSTTAAGLGISYGDGPKGGLLLTPVNFVKSVDEIFRRMCSEARDRGKLDPTNEIASVLQRLMGVVLRDARGVSGSGKGRLSREEYMRDSFLASDNMIAEVKIAFCKLVKDSGLFRRFSFLKVTDEDKKNVQRAAMRPSAEQLLKAVMARYIANGLSLFEVRRFSRWFRRVAADVEVNGEKTFDIVKNIQKEMLRVLWNEIYAGQQAVVDEGFFNDFFERWISEQNIIPNFEGFVRCAAVMRSCIDHKYPSLPKIVVKDADYIEADSLFRRVYKDTFEIYAGGIKKWMKERRIDTIYDGELV